MVQWPRLHVPSAERNALISGQETRSHWPQLRACMPQLKILHAGREQNGGGEGRCGIHLPPWVHQRYTFRHKRHAQYQLRMERNTSPMEKNTEYHTKLGRTEELGGGGRRNRSVSRTGPALGGWGN